MLHEKLRYLCSSIKDSFSSSALKFLYKDGVFEKDGAIMSFLFSLGVQCSAVNVICELARKNPRNYLSLAPLFFKLMTSSSNNWMLIKIIKLVVTI